MTVVLDIWHAGSYWHCLGNFRRSRSRLKGKCFQRDRCDLEWGLSDFNYRFRLDRKVCSVNSTDCYIRIVGPAATFQARENLPVSPFHQITLLLRDTMLAQIRSLLRQLCLSVCHIGDLCQDESTRR